MNDDLEESPLKILCDRLMWKPIAEMPEELKHAKAKSILFGIKKVSKTGRVYFSKYFADFRLDSCCKDENGKWCEHGEWVLENAPSSISDEDATHYLEIPEVID